MSHHAMQDSLRKFRWSVANCFELVPHVVSVKSCKVCIIVFKFVSARTCCVGHAMQFHAISCHVMSCHVMACHVSHVTRAKSQTHYAMQVKYISRQSHWFHYVIHFVSAISCQPYHVSHGM